MTLYLFDLDGVIADGAPGIVNALSAALTAANAPLPDEATLRAQVGRSLPDIFADYLSTPTKTAIDQAIDDFRAYFEAKGMLENTLYDGVRHMLAQVNASGASAYVVTTKPEVYAVRIIDHFGLTDHFNSVIGPGLEEGDTDKTPLVARALQMAGAADDPGVALMLGDRAYDVHGALNNGVRPVGALWGYGGRDELFEAGCVDFVQSAGDFTSRFVARGQSDRP